MPKSASVTRWPVSDPKGYSNPLYYWTFCKSLIWSLLSSLLLSCLGTVSFNKGLKVLIAIQKNAMCLNSDSTHFSSSLDPLYLCCSVASHSCVMLSTATVPIDLHNLPTHSHCLSPAIPEKNCLPITTVSLYPTPDPHIIKVHSLSYLLHSRMTSHPEFSYYCVLLLSLLQETCVYTIFVWGLGVVVFHFSRHSMSG